MKHYFPLFIVLGLLSLSACDDAQTQQQVAMPEQDMGSPCARTCTADNPGHQCCAETFGETFFCSSSLRCIEMAFCESDMEPDLCCQPGNEGNLLCEERLGPGSFCEAQVDVGNCTQVSVECPMCQANNEGHECCQDARGANAYCGGDGTCLEAQTCNADDPRCCVPGASGDARCVENFGESSECQQIGAGFRCSMAATPPCAGCIPDNEGHACCQDARGADWFCGLEQLCRQASGCELDECCVPGQDGDTYCSGLPERENSRCEIVAGDGRCSQP